MNISLDFDNTITRDPNSWDQFIRTMVLAGHKICIVTMRLPSENTDIDKFLQRTLPIEVIYTGRIAKRHFFYADVWIDDCPEFVDGSCYPFHTSTIDELLIDGVIEPRTDGIGAYKLKD